MTSSHHTMQMPFVLPVPPKVFPNTSAPRFQHAPGIPKILVGNRCHLAYKRRVSLSEAEAYAADNRMAFFEMSPLCDFNILESFTELSRLALYRNGMERLWRANKGACGEGGGSWKGCQHGCGAAGAGTFCPEPEPLEHFARSRSRDSVFNEAGAV